MRKTIVTGLILTAAVVLTMLIGAALDLELESVALLGLAVGAIVALVPDSTPGRRVAAYLLGFAVTVLGYLVRAQFLPDTSSGRAIAAGLIVLLCVGVVAISVGRFPLWATLAGTASLVGAFERTYADAPTRVLDNVVSSSTALLLCVAIGFLAAALLSSGRDPQRRDERRDSDETPIDDMMETSR